MVNAIQVKFSALGDIAKSVRIQLVAASDASEGPVVWDMSRHLNFTLTAGENATIANPSNALIGQTYRLQVTQDETGGRVLSWSDAYVFAGGVHDGLTAAAGAVDVYFVHAAAADRFEMTHTRDWKALA